MPTLSVQHLGVYGRILRDGKVLLVKKSRGPYQGKLDLPGGKLEHGETPQEALVREVMEETGLHVVSMVPFGNFTTTVDFVDERGGVSMHHVGLIYDVLIKEGEAVKEMDYEDSLGATWCSVVDLKPEELSPFAAIVLGYE